MCFQCVVTGYCYFLQTTPPTTSNTEETTEFDIKSTTFAAKFAVLPKSRTNIDEKDLYEHATEKQNNQSARAFVYINQRYKKPVRNNIFRLAAPLKAELVPPRRPTPAPFAVTHAPQVPCKPSTQDSRPMASAAVNPFFQGYDQIPDKQVPEIASYFVPPSIFRCNFNEESKKKQEEKTKPLTAHRDDERREYFELLKPPILRPVHRGGNNVLSRNEFSSLTASNVPYKEFYHKKYNVKNQYVPKTKLKVIDDRPIQMRKNIGFSRPYTHHPIFQNKELLHRAEDINFEGDFVNEDDPHRIMAYESNQEEDKLLDKYLKDTLEDQIINHDTVNRADCSYRECVLKSSKQYTNNGLLIKPECKCGRRVNMKQLDQFLAKDRSLREDGKYNDTLLQSAELSYYEDLLADEPNRNKLENEMNKPPNILNETSLTITLDQFPK